MKRFADLVVRRPRVRARGRGRPRRRRGRLRLGHAAAARPRLERLRRQGQREPARRGGGRARVRAVGRRRSSSCSCAIPRARASRGSGASSARSRSSRRSRRRSSRATARGDRRRLRAGGGLAAALARGGGARRPRGWTRCRARPSAGAALATVQVNDQIQHDLTRAEKIAFPILFLLALWVFRSVVAALLPLVCGGLDDPRLAAAAAPARPASCRCRRSRSTSSPARASGSGSTTACCSSLATARSSSATARARTRCVRRCDGRPDGRLLVGHGRRGGRDARDLPARVPAARWGSPGGLVGPLAGLIALTVLPALFFLLGPRDRRAPALAAGGRAHRGRRAGRLVQARARASCGGRCRSRSRRPRCSSCSGMPFLSIRFTGVDAAVLPGERQLAGGRHRAAADFPPTFALARLRGRARRRGAARAYAAAARRAAGRGARAATAPARRRAPGRCGRRRARRSSGQRRSGSSTRCAGCPATRSVGGSTAQYIDQKHALGAQPAARDRPALRRHVRCSSTWRPARSCCR